MLALGVAVVAVAVLFGLTALALAASGRLGHPVRVAAAVAAVLAIGIALTLE